MSENTLETCKKGLFLLCEREDAIRGAWIVRDRIVSPEPGFVCGSVDSPEPGWFLNSVACRQDEVGEEVVGVCVCVCVLSCMLCLRSLWLGVSASSCDLH